MLSRYPILDEGSLWFPPTEMADHQGLLAIGGDLNPKRLIRAYSLGIFPWFAPDEPPLWWSPDPRCVLFPKEAKVSKSMRKVLRDNEFEFTENQCFERVMWECGNVDERQDNTWMTDDFIQNYTTLHQWGFAHSAEAWKNGVLVGGFYYVKLGKVAFGESMFAKVSNASKAVFLNWCRTKIDEVAIVDCQLYSEHLASLGAREIPRKNFEEFLPKLVE